MDEIQRVLIKQGRKDLAQKYYEKIANRNFEPGKWIFQQTGSDIKTYAILINELKNGSWAVVAINDSYKKPAKTSIKGWYPAPSLIDEKDVPEKLKNKVLKKVQSLNLKLAKKKYVDIGDGLYVIKVGKDSNGNSSVWIAKGSGRAKKIQMVGVIYDKNSVMSEKLKYFDDLDNPDVKRTIKEIKDYYKKYM